jgi:hypothetical protein
MKNFEKGGRSVDNRRNNDHGKQRNNNDQRNAHAQQAVAQLKQILKPNSGSNIYSEPGM